jgi:hypothetical protein
MAGRIRTIKPELLEDERAAALSDAGWRLFISALTLADDFGNLRFNDRYLAATIWWARDGVSSKQVSAAMAETIALGMIEPYRSGGQCYGHIRTWDKHQRTDNASKNPRMPGPDKADPGTYVQFRREPPRIAANLGGSPLLLNDPDPYPDHDQPFSLSPSDPPQPPPLPGDPSAKVRAAVDRHRLPAETVLGLFVAARMRCIPGSRAIKPTYDSLTGIAARLDDGHTVEDCAAVIATCEAETKSGNPAKWFNTETVFRPSNFQRKLEIHPEAVDTPPPERPHSNVPGIEETRLLLAKRRAERTEGA